ncbi:hypothetical protein LCGC14_2646170, partial [marine sediment metagenome]
RWTNIYDDSMFGETEYEIIQCVGCDSVRFRTLSWDTESVDPYTGKAVATDRVYPEPAPAGRQPMDTHELPERVARIYVEATKAFNAGAMILSGGGLRAIVEAICKAQAVPGANLAAKIDALAQQGLLAPPQAELLHEERYIGNEALHEVEPPRTQDLADGFLIIDHLLATIYILPKKAKRLKAARKMRKAAKKKAKKAPKKTR